MMDCLIFNAQVGTFEENGGVITPTQILVVQISDLILSSGIAKFGGLWNGCSSCVLPHYYHTLS